MKKQYFYQNNSIYYGTKSQSVKVDRPSLLLDSRDTDDIVILKWGEYSFLNELLNKALLICEDNQWIKGWKLWEVDSSVFTKQEIAEIMNFIIQNPEMINLAVKRLNVCKNIREFYNYCRVIGGEEYEIQRNSI